ncbi:MAG: tRNA/rRNA methyltransferase (SpoU) [Candidatus Angelobacter sp.]|jgi:TrmH family RNA methyltransferase|nr:tRNA/rRNA methyltransferase (SpoU) [Candidatus Angelobacter sp.]
MKKHIESDALSKPSPITIRLRPVQSRQNPTIKSLRRAFSHGELTEDGCCAIESVKIVEEAIRSNLRFHAIVFSESGAASKISEKLLAELPANIEALVVPDDVFKSAVDTESPQGVAALVFPPGFEISEVIAPGSLVVVAAGIQDPGNLGTIVRSAEAFGASGIILGEQTVSRFNAKAIRASAGSLFRLPSVASKLSDAVAELRKKGFRLVGTSSHKGTPLNEAKLSGPVALFIGSEGSGLPASILAQMDEFVTIPHSDKLESLNAGVAASILLYEAARQRRQAGGSA